MYCHDLEVMSSNPGWPWVELGVRSTSVEVTDGQVVRAGISVT